MIVYAGEALLALLAWVFIVLPLWPWDWRGERRPFIGEEEE
jgi:hypothetical protein